MQEIKRVIFNFKFLICLLLIIAANTVMFVSQQADEHYNEDMISYEQQYNSILSEYRNSDIKSAKEAVQLKANEYEILKNISDLFEFKESYSEIFEDRYNFYKTEYPNLLNKFENGKIDTDEITIRNNIYSALLEKIDYISGYDNYLEDIDAQSKSLSSFSIFNDTESFSYRNIQKTADDFAVLKSTNLQLISDSAVEAFFSFKAADYLIFVVIIFLCLMFLNERRKGLWSVIYSGAGGRASLALKRIVVLFFVSMVSVILIYGINLSISFYIYGGFEYLDAPLQSIEIFGSLPLNITVRDFLVIYFIFKIIAVFLLSVLLYVIMSAVNDVKYSITVTAVFLGIEYILFEFLPVQSYANIFKYFNIFSFINLSELFTNYLNVNLFEYAINIRTICMISAIPLCIIMTVVCILIQAYKRPNTGKSVLDKIALWINCISDKITRNFNILNFEIYKLLYLQKGVLVILALVLIAANFNYVSYVNYTEEETIVNQYYELLQGEIDENTLSKIDDLISNNNQKIQEYETYSEKYDKGSINYSDYYMNELNLEGAYKNQIALQQVKSRAEELYDKNEGLWLVDEEGFKSILGYNDGSDLGQNQNCANKQSEISLLSIVVLILMLSGIISFETQSGTKQMLKSMPKGRNKLFKSKILAVLIITVSVWVVSYTGEIIALMSNNSQIFNAPVHSFTSLEKMQVDIKFWQFVVMIYIYRLLALFSIASIIILLSSIGSNINLTYVISCGILVAPSVLYYYLGISFVKFFSASYYLSVLTSVISEYGALIVLLINSAIMFTVGAFSIALAQNRYCNNKC